MIYKDLAQYRSADLMTCDPDNLVDLFDIRIDTSLPLRERMEHYRRQIRDPYLFKVDGLIIKAVYLPDAKNRLCDSLCDLLSEQPLEPPVTQRR